MHSGGFGSNDHIKALLQTVSRFPVNVNASLQVYVSVVPVGYEAMSAVSEPCVIMICMGGPQTTGKTSIEYREAAKVTSIIYQSINLSEI